MDNKYKYTNEEKVKYINIYCSDELKQKLED